MINAVEASNLGHGVGHRVGQLVKGQVGGRDHLPLDQHFLDVLMPARPVIAPRLIHQHDREDMALARLD